MTIPSKPLPPLYVVVRANTIVFVGEDTPSATSRYQCECWLDVRPTPIARECSIVEYRPYVHAVRKRARAKESRHGK